jgi:hypothetical protein
VQERLKKVVIVDAPSVFGLLHAAVWPFVDPVTRSKVHFVYTKMHDVATGLKLSGAADPAGFSDLWQFYVKPYSKDRYLDLLTALEQPAMKVAQPIKEPDQPAKQAAVERLVDVANQPATEAEVLEAGAALPADDVVPTIKP